MSNNPRRTTALSRSAKGNDAYTIPQRSLSQSALDRMESTPTKDTFAQDPFVSISRAIHSAKIRAGNRLRTMSTPKYQRPRPKWYQMLTNRTTRTVLITISAIALLSILTRQPITDHDNASFWHEIHNTVSTNSLSLRQAMAHRPPAATSKNFETGPWVIGLIADLDKESCQTQTRDEPPRTAPCAKANTWVSYIKRGKLEIPAVSGKHGDTKVSWLDEVMLRHRGHFEVEVEDHDGAGGRAMELSELEWFHGHLLTPDDHTGYLLEIMSPRGALANASDAFHGESSKVPPSTFGRAVLYDGDGEDAEGVFKSEWMAVKEDKLYIGGHGKAYTDPMDGTVVRSDNPKWIKIVDKQFEVTHANWTEQYARIAESVGVSFPGYLMHEAVLWSPDRSEWVFLPRRVSKEPFDPTENETKGSNFVITANEDFSMVKSVEIEGLKDSTGFRGFSSAKFVPGTGDRLIAALRTSELDPTDGNEMRKTETFFSIFEIPSGRIVYEEEQISGKKYEGLVFL